MRLIPPAVLFVFVGLFFPPSVLGQSMHGRVLVEGDTLGIDGATLTVFDSAGTAVFQGPSGVDGGFRIAVPGPGWYEVVATRLGYARSAARIRLLEEEMVELELRMAEEAILLEPINVTARRRIREGTLDEFYDRMARMQQAGRGYFITRDEIEGSGVSSIPMLLHQVPGIFILPSGMSGHSVRMRRPRRFCTPALYIDGRPQDYARVPAMEDLEGIEVYRGRFEVVPGYWPDDCGIIFLWRKKDWGNPFSWRRAMVVGGFFAILLALIAD